MAVETVQRVLQLHGRECLIEELMDLCPELTWNQVFLLVDELSRQALIRLRRRGFEYELRALA